MDRARKEKVVAEIGQIFESSGVVVVAKYEGMTVPEMENLRSLMREAGGFVRVAKNRLSKIALQGSPCEKVGSLLTGMTLLAYSEDPTVASKVSKDFASSNKNFVVLGGAVGSSILDPKGIEAVASMPSREDLIASVVSCIGSPGATLLGAIGAPASSLASVLTTLEEREAA